MAFQSNRLVKSSLVILSAICCISLLGLGIANGENIDDKEDASRTIAPNILPREVLPFGAAKHHIPIKVPPGRNGLAPDITLNYNSYQKNGWLGVGWDLDMGSIRRSTKRGVDYSAHDFIAGEYELDPVNINASGTGEYRAEIESGFTKYNFSHAAGWVATLRNGTRKYYGNAADNREDNACGVFKWYLSRVEDPNGNFIEIDYEKDTTNGILYLKEIRYTGNGDLLNPANTVRFILEERPDIVPSYVSNSKAVMTKRLKMIEVYGNAQLAGTYVLDYENGSYSSRSRLKEIQLFGSEDSLPPTTFRWKEGGNGTFGDRNTAAYDKVTGASFGDINGDGFIDLITSIDDPSVQKLSIHFSNGDGTFEAPVTYDPSWKNYPFSVQILPADVNGDGKCDVIHVLEFCSEGMEWYDFTYAIYISLSNGDGTFIYSDMIDIKEIFGDENSVSVYCSDVNGDGFIDIVHNLWLSSGVAWYLSNGDGTFETRREMQIDDQVVLSLVDLNGDGRGDLVTRDNHEIYTRLGDENGNFAVSSQTIPNPISCSYKIYHCEECCDFYRRNYKYDFADINGDGLADLISRCHGDRHIYISFSKGDGTFDAPIVFNMPAGSIPRSFRFGDINGDGLCDLVNHNCNNGYVYMSRGDGTFEHVSTFTGERSRWAWAWTLVDVTGDGLADLNIHDYSYFPESGYKKRYCDVHTYVSAGDGPPDLLREIHNGQGGTIAFDYKSSAGNQSHANGAYLPFILHTVSSVTTKDGLGNISRTSCTYSDGFYDSAEREFLGFRKCFQTNPDHSTLTTFFHNHDKYLRGRQHEVILQERGAESAVLNRIIYDWQAVSIGGDRRFVKLDSKETETVDSRITVKTMENYTYDERNGFVKKKTHSVLEGGEGEDVTEISEYINVDETDDGWIWRLSETRIEGRTDKNSTGIVRKTTYKYYDGTGDHPGGLGNLKYKQEWIDKQNYLQSEYQYDKYGNIHIVIDPKGFKTKTDYDYTHTFPAAVTYPSTGNVLHRAEYPEYDYRFGKLKKGIDENGNITSCDYDPFGRTILVEKKDDQETLIIKHVETEYHDAVLDENNSIVVPKHIVSKVQEDDQGSTIDGYVYFDGSGRKIQTTSLGAGCHDDQPGKAVYKEILTRTYYDEMGREYLRVGPFFRDIGTGFYNTPADDLRNNIECPWVKTAYDKRSRPVELRSPANFTLTDSSANEVITTFDYDGLSRKATDPDGARKTEIKDYLGRIIEVIEYEDIKNEEYHTYYEYNAAGDLIWIQDQLNNISSVAHDTLGRKISITDPDIGCRSYAYDANGNIKRQTDAKNETITYDYDELNRVTSKRYSPSGSRRNVSYSYDNVSVDNNGIGKPYQIIT